MNPQTPTSIFSQPPYVHLPSSHKGLKRALIAFVIAALLAAGGYAVYYFFVSPAAQAERTATSYINALTTDDVDLAAYLSRDDADFSLLESASQAIKGEYKLTGKTELSGSYYFLYSLSNATNKYARLIVVSTAKGYRVSSFLYSADALALIPGTAVAHSTGAVASPAATAPKQQAASGTSSGSSGAHTGSGGAAPSAHQPAAVAAACLAQSDYSAVFVDAAADETIWSADNPYSDVVSFDDNSSSYVDDFETGDVYAMWVQFYRANPSKNYQFHVQAMMPSSSSDTSLADQRAATVVNSLISVGVPSGMIVTDSPANLPDDGEDDGGTGYVTLSVVPGC